MPTEAEVYRLACELVEQRYGSTLDDEAESQLIEAHYEEACKMLATSPDALPTEESE